MTAGRRPNITLEALDSHPLCNRNIDSKQGAQKKPRSIISKCEFRCITWSTMPESLWESAGVGGRAGAIVEVMWVKKLKESVYLFEPAYC